MKKEYLNLIALLRTIGRLSAIYGLFRVLYSIIDLSKTTSHYGKMMIMIITTIIFLIARGQHGVNLIGLPVIFPDDSLSMPQAYHSPYRVKL